MPARKVDIVFCLDTSDSMKPCIDAVRDNIGRLIRQLRQANFEWRLDYVAHNVCGYDNGSSVYTHNSLYGDPLDIFYHDSSPRFFTTDEEEFKRGLAGLECEGDESMLLALDVAMDAPFGPANETQRVIVLISDEAFETNEASELETARSKVDDIKQKLMDRHITLLAVMPVREGGIAESLSEVDRSDFMPVEENDLGLRKVNMVDLFSQLGRTISTFTVQSNGRENYHRALFGQDEWGHVDNYDSIGDSK